MVITVGSLAAALVATELPASASVTSAPYTIGSPGSAVGTVSATPLTTTISTATAFEIGFTTPSALSGASDASITVTPSQVLGGAPTQVALTGSGGSCIQSGTAGAGGAGFLAANQVTIELGASCSFAAGSSVQVYLSAPAPATAGTFYFSVTTSANPSAATSNTIAVASSQATLSAVHYTSGDNTTYTITGIPVGTGGNGTTITLSAIPTTGTETITFFNTGAYQVLVAAPGGSATNDPVQSATSSGPTVTLGLANAVAVGDTLTISAVGTNPAANGSPQADAISVNVNSATAVRTNSISFGTSVSAITVSPSTAVAGATSAYTVKFTATTAASGFIYLSETAGPTNFLNATTAEVLDSTRAWFTFDSVSQIATGEVAIPIGNTIEAGDQVTITLANVVNPPAGTVTDFDVWTTADYVPSAAAAFGISSNASPSVTVTVSSPSVSTLATYTINNVYASAALSAGSSTLSLTGPAGTVFPNATVEYTILDLTSNASGTVSSGLSGGATNSVTFTLPINVASGDRLTIIVADVLNPPTASATDSITLGGNVTGPAPQAPTTTTTVPTTTTTTKPPVPSASIVTSKAYVKNKAVHLRVFCSAVKCQGTITLTDVRTVVASKTYTVAAGKSTLYTVTINSKGLRLLASAPHKTVHVTEKVTVNGGKAISKKIALIG